MKYLKLLFVALFFVLLSSCAENNDNSYSEQIVIAFVGDSTSMGFGANGGAEIWVENSISYMFTNLPELGPNFDGTNEFYLGSDFPYISQEHQDNISIPSAVRLLRTEIEIKKPGSIIYNFSGSGWTASSHVDYETMFAISQLTPKPEFVLINLGINSAKNNLSQKEDIKTIVEQAFSHNITPILVKPNNIAVCYSPDGDWCLEASPYDWFPMDNWNQARQEIDDVAKEYDLNIIDLGSDDGEINIDLLYDPFHPNDKGYHKIYKIYLGWFKNEYQII